MFEFRVIGPYIAIFYILYPYIAIFYIVVTQSLIMGAIRTTAWEIIAWLRALKIPTNFLVPSTIELDRQELFQLLLNLQTLVDKTETDWEPIPAHVVYRW